MIEKRTQEGKISPLRVVMRLLGRLLSGGKEGDNTRAVQMMYRIDVLKDVLKAYPLRRFGTRGGKSCLASNFWCLYSG